MTSPSSFGLNRKNFPVVTAILTAVVAIAVLFGWMADIQILKSVLPSLPAMKPITAVAFLFACAGLFFTARSKKFSGDIYIAVISGAVVFLIGGVIVVEYIARSNFFSTRVFSSLGDEQAVRMSPQSALNFALLGVSTILIATGNAGKASAILLTLVRLITIVAMLGVLYGAQTIFGLTQHSFMAVHTALIFFALTAALDLKDGNSLLSRILESTGAGAAMGRRIIPVVLVVPPIVGLVLHFGFQIGLYDASFSLALTVSCSMIVMALILVYYSMSIDELDRSGRRIEADLAEKEARYRELFDYSQGMICIHDIDGVLRSVNPAVLSSTGYSRDEIVGKNIIEFLPREHRVGIAAFLRQIEHEGLSNGLMPIVAKDGRRLMWRYKSILVTEEEREPYVIGHALDVTELMAAQSELKNLSLTDELTGLYNRRGFLTLAEQQLKLETHNGTARGLTLLFADMDGLKSINDTYGHEAGSEAIAMLARLIKSVVRDADLVARFGGDEFVILSIGSQDDNSRLVIDRITERLNEYNTFSGKPYKIACSIGIAPVRMDGRRSFEEVIAEADEAMYEEKKKRKAKMKPLPPRPADDEGFLDGSVAWY